MRSTSTSASVLSINGSCTACGVCILTCPTSALLSAPRRPAIAVQRCTLCLECIEVCPADAIDVVPR